MATLVRVDEIRGKTATVEVTSTITATQDRKFQVEYSDSTVEPADAVYAAGLPVFGDVLGTGSMVLRRKRADQDPNKPELFEVTCTYEFPQPGEEEAPAEPDAEGERWAIEISMQTVPYEIELQYDALDYAIANSAGDPVSGVMVPRSDIQVVVAFTTNLVDWDGIDTCINKVNSDDVTMTINGQTRVYGAGTLWFRDLSIVYTPDGEGGFHARVTYFLMHRLETWRRRLVDRGLYSYDGDADIRAPFTDKYGSPITTPVLMDGAGGLLAPGEDVVILPTDAGRPNVNEGVPVFVETEMGSSLLWEIGT